MKYVLSICGMLALSTTAYGQQTGNREQAAVCQRANGEPIRQTVAADIQVDLQLRILEVSLTKLQRLGIDLTKLSGDPIAKPNVDQADANAQSFLTIDDGNEAWLVLNARRRDNLAKVLAEPILATRSGKTTVFNLGDKLAVPKQLKDGSVTIEQQHAIVIKVTPEVSGDMVRLAIHGQLTDLDQEHRIRVGKETVPGVRVHEFTTRAEVRSGQALALRGPTQTRTEAINRGVPFVSEIPYVGAVFRNVESQQNDIATFILVRPEVVQSPLTAVPSIVDSQDDTPTPQAVQSVNASIDAPPATARRAAVDNTQR